MKFTIIAVAFVAMPFAAQSAVYDYDFSVEVTRSDAQFGASAPQLGDIGTGDFTVLVDNPLADSVAETAYQVQTCSFFGFDCPTFSGDGSSGLLLSENGESVLSYFTVNDAGQFDLNISEGTVQLIQLFDEFAPGLGADEENLGRIELSILDFQENVTDFPGTPETPDIAPVPLPASGLLLLAGLGGLGVWKRRKAA